LDQIAAPAAEDEDMTRVRVLLQFGLCHRTQTCESAPQIGDAGSNPDVRAGWQRNHRATRSRIRRRLSASTVPSTRMRALPNSTTITPLYNFAGGCSPLTTSAILTGTSSAATDCVSNLPSRYSFRQ